MRPRLSRLAISLVLMAILQLAACNVPDREEPEEPAAEDMLAVVTLNANVRTGPSTDYAIAFGLTAGEEVTVVGRNAAGDWLQIKHQDRTGWIFAALTDLVTETAAELPADVPPPVTATPTAEPEPTEPTIQSYGLDSFLRLIPVWDTGMGIVFRGQAVPFPEGMSCAAGEPPGSRSPRPPIWPRFDPRPTTSQIVDAFSARDGGA